MPLFRIPPKMGVRAYKTYGFRRPLKTHWRAALCDEVDCGAFLNGWVTVVDESTDLGQGQANYIRKDKTRKHTEEREPTGLTKFTFPAGQACFGQSTHRVPEDKMPLFYVRDGDYRGNPTGVSRVHQSPENWVEDMAEHQNRLIDTHRERLNIMAKTSGLGGVVIVADSGTGRTITNDCTNWAISTPRAVQDVTGIDKSANERILLLADISFTLNGVFNAASNQSHAVFSSVPSTSVIRGTTVQTTSVGSTLATNQLYTDYQVTRANTGELTWQVPGVLADGSVPTWT